MSNYSRPNNQHIAALKGYAAEVLRQYEEKEAELLKAEKTFEEIKEMQRIYPEDEELLDLFQSQSRNVDQKLLELHELEGELEAAKKSLKEAMGSRNQESSNVAMQVVEAHMSAAGLEMPRVSPIAKQMEEEARRQKLEALKAARSQKLETEDASTPLDVENDSIEDDEGIEDDSEKVFQRKPL